MAASSSWKAASKSTCRCWRKKTKSLARLMRCRTACSAADGSIGGCQGWGRIALLLPARLPQGGAHHRATIPVNDYLTGALETADQHAADKPSPDRGRLPPRA